jgi:hypothetical protein
VGGGFSKVKQDPEERNPPLRPHPTTHPHSHPQSYPTIWVIILARKSQGETPHLRIADCDLRIEKNEPIAQGDIIPS